MAKISTIGSRAQVWHGTAKKTSGGLTKSHLFMNKSGHIVSKAKHFTAKKEKRLLKHGYGTKKGVFGFVKTGSKSMTRSRRHSKRHKRGGMHGLVPLELGMGMGDGIAGQGITPGGPQTIAGMAGGRRHRRHKSHKRGGSGMAPFASPGSAMWEGDTSLGSNMGMDGSNDVQFAAGMAGGRHSRRHSRRGGTTSRLGLGQGGIPGMGSGLSSLPAAV